MGVEREREYVLFSEGCSSDKLLYANQSAGPYTVVNCMSSARPHCLQSLQTGRYVKTHCIRYTGYGGGWLAATGELSGAPATGFSLPFTTGNTPHAMACGYDEVGVGGVGVGGVGVGVGTSGGWIAAATANSLTAAAVRFLQLWVSGRRPALCHW
jgi:hypothetical protein